MKDLSIKVEKPFNWIEGFEGVYLINEDKLIKKPRITILSGRKKSIQEASYIEKLTDEQGEIYVILMKDGQKEKKYLVKNLIPIKYIKAKEHRKNIN